MVQDWEAQEARVATCVFHGVFASGRRRICHAQSVQVYVLCALDALLIVSVEVYSLSCTSHPTTVAKVSFMLLVDT